MKGKSQDVIANVLQVVQKEADEHKFVIPVTKVHKHVVSTTSNSKSTIKTIKKEMLNLHTETGTSCSTPNRNGNCPQPCTKIADFNIVWCVEKYTDSTCMIKGYQWLKLC
jgi:hypothetical protein